jgi:hypothetical protein
MREEKTSAIIRSRGIASPAFQVPPSPSHCSTEVVFEPFQRATLFHALYFGRINSMITQVD